MCVPVGCVGDKDSAMSGPVGADVIPVSSISQADGATARPCRSNARHTQRQGRAPVEGRVCPVATGVRACRLPCCLTASRCQVSPGLFRFFQDCHQHTQTFHQYAKALSRMAEPFNHWTFNPAMRRSMRRFGGMVPQFGAAVGRVSSGVLQIV